MEERRALMQSWADMLEAFKAAAVAQADQHTP
jgi:hypothetical protein